MRRQLDWEWYGRCRGAHTRAPAASIARHLPLLMEQRVDVNLGRERNEVVDAFADADVADGQLQIVCDGDRDAALRCSVEFSQDDTRHAGDARELTRLRKAVLPYRRVEDEQHFVRCAVRRSTC